MLLFTRYSLCITSFNITLISVRHRIISFGVLRLSTMVACISVLLPLAVVPRCREKCSSSMRQQELFNLPGPPFLLAVLAAVFQAQQPLTKQRACSTSVRAVLAGVIHSKLVL